jgi:hypothetical protein
MLVISFDSPRTNREKDAFIHISWNAFYECDLIQQDDLR